MVIVTGRRKPAYEIMGPLMYSIWCNLFGLIKLYCNQSETFVNSTRIYIETTYLESKLIVWDDVEIVLKDEKGVVLGSLIIDCKSEKVTNMRETIIITLSEKLRFDYVGRMNKILTKNVTTQN